MSEPLIVAGVFIASGLLTLLSLAVVLLFEENER